MKQPSAAPFRILIANDDTDDVQLTRDCFDENKLPIHVNEVCDGQYLMGLFKRNYQSSRNKKFTSTYSARLKHAA